MITQEQLMAYVDGEASEDVRAAIDVALSADEGLRGRIAEERRLRRYMANLYAPALNEPVPERLTDLLRHEKTNVVAFAAPRRRPLAWRWPAAAAAVAAASLAIGLVAGGRLDTIGAGAPDSSMLQARGALAKALQTELASSQAPSAPVRIGISFRDSSGQPCRTFETAEAAGLACRSAGAWRLALVAAIPAARTSEYRQAGSADALIMSAAQELIAGEPMTAEEERQARDAGWPRGGH